RLSGFERRALEANSVLAGDMADMLHNLPIVRLYQLQPTLGRKYACASKQAYQARLQYKWMRGFTDGILDFIAFSAQTLVLLAGILQFDRGGSAAQLVFASSMYALMLSAVRDLGSAVMFMQEGIESAKRMYQLLDRPTEQSCGDGDADEVDTDEMDADESAVAFRHVTFSYMGDKNVLDDVSISVPKGAFVAIVGGSGSGKTTIAKLIMGMYDLKHGHIYVGGTNIACTSKDRLREKIAYIPQEPTLFYGTVQQNVRLWADGGEGTAYLRQVALDLDGDTPVGEMGKALSGGQAQRVTIARALAHDAELYILDEATSALDYETERIIRRVIERDLAGKTCICITHRL
ncbi:MAG: ABC transporter ATP-binding protein, partial [Clostridia bacterium]